MTPLVFVVYLITSVLIYYGFSDSMGTIQLGLAVLTMIFYIKNPKTIHVVPVLLFTLFALILLVFSGQMSVVGFNAPIKHALKFVHLLYACTCGLFMRYVAEDREKKVFIIGVIATTIVSCVRSVILVMTSGNAYAIRYASRYGYDTGDVLGFNQIYAIPFCIILVLFLLLEKKFRKPFLKVILIGVLLVYIYFTIVSLFTTALVITAAGVILYLGVRAYRRKASIMLVISTVIITFFMMLISIFSDRTMDFIIDATSDMNYITRNRLRYISEAILGLSSGISYSYDRRQELMGYSLESFSQHPIFGVGYAGYRYGTIGCHQEWADLLGVFGIIGTIVVALILFGIFFNVYRDISDRHVKDLYLVMVVVFVVLGFLNPCISDPLFIILLAVVPNLGVMMKEAKDE